MTRYYIAWNDGRGGVYARCFSSEKERADFSKMIECYKFTTWEV